MSDKDNSAPSEKRDTNHEARALLQNPMVQRASAQCTSGGSGTPTDPQSESEAHPSQPDVEGTPRLTMSMFASEKDYWKAMWEGAHLRIDTLERELAFMQNIAKSNLRDAETAEAAVAGLSDLLKKEGAALAAAARDAERYRWLRACGKFAPGHRNIGWSQLLGSPFEAKSEEYMTRLDAAIDAARAGKEGA
jgi:hypothetical protein